MNPILAAAEIFRCPRCLSQLRQSAAAFACSGSNCIYSDPQLSFPVIDGQPVLIDFEKSLFDRQAFDVGCSAAPPGGEAAGSAFKQQWRKVRKRVLRGGNRAAERMVVRFLADMKGATATGTRPRLLIVGGATIGAGSEAIYGDPGIDTLGTDVFPTRFTHVVSDAHQLPFASESFDGVWIQAVLEHVLDPGKVVAQIHRVLRPRGVVYADTPFLQQVHMGAYDFTRFTLSGHRWLFRQFEQIDAGISAGPGVAMIWSIRYLARALGAGEVVAGAVAAPFFWLRFLDRFATSQAGADAASGVYFWGRKSDRALHPKDMISYYYENGART